MKKTLISIVAVAFVALMIATVYAPRTIPPATIPAPTFCEDRCPGFTPGFWKHNIKVRLGLTNGAYSAFEGGPRDGQKLTDELMDLALAAINTALGAMGVGPFTFADLLEYLEGPGWSLDRTNTANWFNKVAGYGPF